MKFFIPIICLITILGNSIYIFYGSSNIKQHEKTGSLYVYKTPDNEIWINKDKLALERLRNNYIKGSDSIITSLEAENQHVMPFQHLEPEAQEKLAPSYKMSFNFFIFNSLIIVSGFSAIYISSLKRKKTVNPKSSDYSYNNTNEQEKLLIESTITNKSSNNDPILNKLNYIICEILQIINKYSESNCSTQNNSFDNFTNEQISKIKSSRTMDDLLTIEHNINKTIPKNFEKTKNLLNIKFKELRAMLNELAEGFGSIAKDNTNFSSHVKNSISHIEKTIELDEIKEIRNKIKHETKSLSKTITKKQEKDSIIIDSLTNKVKAMNEELASVKEKVLIDGLTQIFNRKAFDSKMSNAFKKKSRDIDPFTLAIADIDFFKKINDEYGHTVGDEVLRNVARTIKKVFRSNDFVSRYGGEEFAIIIKRIDMHYIQNICERLRSSIEAMNITIDNNTIPISISIGIAFCNQSDTSKTLIDRADKALYLAKLSGRNTIKTEEDLSKAEMETVST
ncbi:MAG: GGDEF domain-containing protein [Planctomycetota bacterium]